MAGIFDIVEQDNELNWDALIVKITDFIHDFENRPLIGPKILDFAIHNFQQISIESASERKFYFILTCYKDPNGRRDVWKIRVCSPWDYNIRFVPKLGEMATIFDTTLDNMGNCWSSGSSFIRYCHSDDIASHYIFEITEDMFLTLYNHHALGKKAKL